MYGLLLQVRPSLCTFVPSIRLPVVMHDKLDLREIDREYLSNMSTLRVNFLAASLPRIPGYMVLVLFFGFSMSSTMTAPFLYHVVRDRECIQS